MTVGPATSTEKGTNVQTPFTVRVQAPLEGAFEIENTVKSSVGTCPDCTVVNPTGPELVTTKAIATVNGAPASDQTQIPAGAEVSYQITTTNNGGTAAKEILTETVPAHTSFVGPCGAGGWTC